MTINRRQFIARTGLLAGSFLGRGLLGGALTQRALADTIGDRFFVVVFLDGGNDGLNTVAPVDDGSIGGLRGAYEAARFTGSGGLRLPSGALLGGMVDPATGTPLGFHPGLAGLHSLYGLGKVAVVQGCGYPDANLSHDESRRIWETAVPSGGGGDGWIGRYLAANYGGADIPAVNVQSSISGDFANDTTSVLTVSRLDRFDFPYGAEGAEEAARRAALLGLCGDAAGSGQGTLEYVGNNTRATIEASDSYPQLHGLYVGDRPAWNAGYDALGTSTARDLREVAKVIYGVESGVPNVNARFFEVRNGGYDTHSDQGGAEVDGQHTSLHREVGGALEQFYMDCADMGVADKLVVLVWSEFSRRVVQNENGTDHGSQGPVFVVGGAVNGGVYGSHPDIREAALDDGNTVYTQSGPPQTTPFRSTDIRDIYGTVLVRWLGMPIAEVASLLPPDAGDPDENWTVPNFDMGFI
jgi:uncharacterized protein (DUF1501 family)